MYQGKTFLIQVEAEDSNNQDSNKEDGDSKEAKEGKEVKEAGEEVSKEAKEGSRDGEEVSNSKEVLVIDGEEEITTIKCRAINMSTMDKDGTTIMTRDFSNKFKSFSKNMIKITLDSSRDRSSSMLTETFACKWEWLLQITISKFGKQYNRRIKIAMERLTNKK